MLYRIADVYGFMGMYMFEIRRHVERYSIDNAAGTVIFQLQLYICLLYTSDAADEY